MLSRLFRIGYAAIAAILLSLNGVNAQIIPYSFGSPPAEYQYGTQTPSPDATPYVVRPFGIYKIFAGTVKSFSGYNLRFMDGRRVTLFPDTVIDPAGATIRRGMIISVHGFFREGGAIGAKEIVIVNGDGSSH